MDLYHPTYPQPITSRLKRKKLLEAKVKSWSYRKYLLLRWWSNLVLKTQNREKLVVPKNRREQRLWCHSVQAFFFSSVKSYSINAGMSTLYSRKNTMWENLMHWSELTPLSHFYYSKLCQQEKERSCYFPFNIYFAHATRMDVCLSFLLVSAYSHWYTKFIASRLYFFLCSASCIEKFLVFWFMWELAFPQKFQFSVTTAPCIFHL